MKNLLISKNHFKFRHKLILNQTIHRRLRDTPAIQCLEKEAQITWVPGGCSYNTMRIFNVK